MKKLAIICIALFVAGLAYGASIRIPPARSAAITVRTAAVASTGTAVASIPWPIDVQCALASPGVNWDSSSGLWADVSGNRHHASQTTSAQKPVYDGAEGGLRFTEAGANSSRLLFGVPWSMTTATITIVIKYKSSGAKTTGYEDIVYGSINVGNTFFDVERNVAVSKIYLYPSNAYSAPTVSTATSSTFVWSNPIVVTECAASATISVGSTSNSASGWSAPRVVTFSEIGNDTVNSAQTDGWIRGVWIFNRTLTLDERSSIPTW